MLRLLHLLILYSIPSLTVLYQAAVIGKPFTNFLPPRLQRFMLKCCTEMRILLSPRFTAICTRRTIQTLAGDWRRCWLSQAWPYIAPGEERLVASELFCHAMNHYAPDRLFDELLALRHTRPGLRKQLLAWGRRWNLLDARGRLPRWLAQQVSVAFEAWDHWWPCNDQHVPRCWPLIGSDWWSWAPLGSRSQQKAARFARRHPQFDPALVRRNDQWLHRQWARYLGLTMAPRIELAHFGWAVEFQCAGVRISEIADRPDVNLTRQATHKAVMNVLRLCGLVPRRDRPGFQPGRRRDG
jgi:hypothetical protein